MQVQKYYIGVDVSKETLDFALVKEGIFKIHSTISNSPKEIKKLLSQWSKEFKFSLNEITLCFEHTGIYCNHLINCLTKDNIQFCLENAYNIKHSNGLQRGKNDKVDAERIAIYAWKNKDTLKQWQAPKETVTNIKQLLNIRKTLINAKKNIKLSISEQAKFIDKGILKTLEQSIVKSIKSLDDDILKIEKKILVLIKSDSQISRMYDVLMSIEGVGKITAVMFIICTNAFTLFSCAKKFACYAGVVPFENKSGTSIRGKSRVSNFSNKEMKTALHMCAVSSCQRDGDLGEYYRRKTSEGKNKMSVINAMRNKIILRVFACIKADKLYQNQNMKKAI